MKWLQQIPAIFRSKYLVAAALFGIIVLFFDKNDFFTQQERKKEVRELEQSKAYYLKQMEELTRIRQDVENDPNTIEKLAREQYLMKRP
ncbi:MAG: septum formation initiator family protein, partial [Pedobacter sp.]